MPRTDISNVFVIVGTKPLRALCSDAVKDVTRPISFVLDKRIPDPSTVVVEHDANDKLFGQHIAILISIEAQVRGIGLLQVVCEEVVL